MKIDIDEVIFRVRRERQRADDVSNHAVWHRNSYGVKRELPDSNWHAAQGSKHTCDVLLQWLHEQKEQGVKDSWPCEMGLL